MLCLQMITYVPRVKQMTSALMYKPLKSPSVGVFLYKMRIKAFNSDATVKTINSPTNHASV